MPYIKRKQEVFLDSILVNGSNSHITLDPDTADDAAFTIVPTTGGSNGVFVKFGDSDWHSTVPTDPVHDSEGNLVDGAYSIRIGTSAETVACDANYTCICDAPGTRKLVFNAVNDYGVSPAYTVTLSVVPVEAIHEVNYEIDGAVIEWFGFTDENYQPLPEGTTYT